MSEISINELVDEWLRIDVNPSTRDEMIELQKNNEIDELELRLRDRIMFGTAGLRARMEAGFSRMNNVTVLQASQGLASYILHQNIAKPSIVIGHDHRHNSEIFAKLAALAFILKGIKVYYLGSDIVPTPLVPFAVDYLHLSGGIMITASHNPAKDNGYKVYWGNGCQIIPPHDLGIQEQIMQNLEPVLGSWDVESVFQKGLNDGLLENRRQELIELYLDCIAAKLFKSTVKDLTLVYTPMHGVGLQFVEKILQRLGLNLIVPQEQAQPDPDFPTVAFPNPEEKGALEIAMLTADKNNLSLVLANDPDADRFSCAIKHEEKWRQLSGNEIGFLFADFIVDVQEPDSKTFMLNSTVSSQMIKSVAEKRGFQYEDTLTGFKWIGNKAIDLEAEGYKVPFAYEEAIGFMFDVVHDKDGISALVIFSQLYQHWQNKGTNIVERLENGFKEYGFFKEFNGYYIVPDLLTTPKIFNQVIRKYLQGEYPKTIKHYKVISWRDLTIGFDSSTPDNKPVLPIDASSQMITLILKPITTNNEEEFIRFTARGSGTEPKLKLYIEGKSNNEARALELAQDVWQVLKEEWFQPQLFNLVEKC